MARIFASVIINKFTATAEGKGNPDPPVVLCRGQTAPPAQPRARRLLSAHGGGRSPSPSAPRRSRRSRRSRHLTHRMHVRMRVRGVVGIGH